VQFLNAFVVASETESRKKLQPFLNGFFICFTTDQILWQNNREFFFCQQKVKRIKSSSAFTIEANRSITKVEDARVQVIKICVQ